MSHTIFIAGTDTDCGKTYVSVALLKGFNQRGYSTLGIKPIASGCSMINNSLQNSDALALQQASSVKLDYSAINPFAFEPAIAPHVAAEKINQPLSLSVVLEQLNESLQHPADIKIIEGAGGLQVPLNDHQSMLDLMNHINSPIILVVGMKLGCINHAILSANAIAQANIPLMGWIANCVEPTMQALQENRDTLKTWLKIPYLGMIPYNAPAEDFIDFDQLKILANRP